MVLSNYLQKHGQKIGDVIEQLDYSQKEIEKMDIILYPNKVIERIGEVVEKNKSSVLFELLMLKRAKDVTEVTSIEQLAEAIKNRRLYIYIPKPARSNNSRFQNSKSTKKNSSDLELGAKSGVNILGEISNRLQKLYNGKDAEYENLEEKLHHYRLKLHDESGSILYDMDKFF